MIVAAKSGRTGSAAASRTEAGASSSAAIMRCGERLSTVNEPATRTRLPSS